jgi:hypothetical protein
MSELESNTPEPKTQSPILEEDCGSPVGTVSSAYMAALLNEPWTEDVDDSHSSPLVKEK